LKQYLFFAILISHTCCFGQALSLLELKKIIGKGICSESSEKCKLNQLNFMNACEKVGDYYAHKNDYKKSLDYYLLVANLSEYAEGKLQFDEPIKLRNKVSSKAGYIYFYGKGVKKDLQKSIFQHCRTPIYLSTVERNKYSKLYFNNIKPCYPFPKKLYQNDSSQAIRLNPFFIDKQNIFDDINNQLIFFENKLAKDTTLKCKITIYLGCFVWTEINQNYFTKILEKLNIITKKFCKGNHYIERISSEIIYDENNSLKYKGVYLPTLNIEVKH
jgi:hypothetical protein